MAKLKLLLDENIGRRVAVALRGSGYDVASILEDAPGSIDYRCVKPSAERKTDFDNFRSGLRRVDFSRFRGAYKRSLFTASKRKR